MQHILSENSASILLIQKRVKQHIVVGAPHHTPGGNKNMPCPEHTAGDENTGNIALMLAERLNVSSIIACNYPIDPNKCLNTDYSSQIQRWKPEYLVEIHGHGAREECKKPDGSTIEVSCGKKDRKIIAIRFAATLNDLLRSHSELEGVNVKGEWSEIYFKASTSLTITDERWIPFHIELPPFIRLAADNKLPDFISKFIDCLAVTIEQVCK